ncbi:MAG: hypothetical protein MRECE_5c029 [Mycoplasmataceae bacterium CE_OT135]|nr:MAG: hypothetical protein MRECE_6c047 [Mycoplasmataceae bacterium CE_OT135]KLL03985.1 MAG: hypothetical protein MRECE_5c029 [Mycoplasmataceae bacterium CE_OT135]
MENAKLLENTSLCYLSLSKLQEWLKENDLWEKDFAEIKKQWKQELENNLPSFFIDTELLMSEKDVILLQVEDENVIEYLAKTYQVKEQLICQKLFGENKHFILLTKRQWQEMEEFNKKNKKGAKDPSRGQNDISQQVIYNQKQENCFILLKDEETIKNNLTKWLEKKD